LSLEQKKYYLEKEFSGKRELLKNITIDFFIEANVDEKTAETHAELILQIETRLAQNSQSENELSNFNKNYNIFSKSKLENKFNNIKWDYYFERLELKDNKIIIGQPDYFEELNDMLSQISIEEWKIYLKWRLLFKT
jgi:putative endopeptidase